MVAGQSDSESDRGLDSKSRGADKGTGGWPRSQTGVRGSDTGSDRS